MSCSEANATESRSLPDESSLHQPTVFLQGPSDVILLSHLAQDMPTRLSTGMSTFETPCLSQYWGNTRVTNGVKYVFLVTNMDVTEGALFRVDKLLLGSARNF
jgi:hypothetical protein